MRTENHIEKMLFAKIHALPAEKIAEVQDFVDFLGARRARFTSGAIINRELIKQTIQKLKVFSSGHTLGGLDWKVLRDEGRR